MAVVVIDICCI